MRNVEIKAKVQNIVELVQKAKKLSDSEGVIINQHDTFYNVNSGRLKLRKFEDGKAELIFYDRPNTEGPKLCSYEKCDIDSSNTATVLNSVLEKSLGAKSVVKKVRELFLVGQTRVHIDSVEGLGNFMELEVVLTPEQTPEEGERIADDLMKKLGVEKEDLISGAYTDLLNNQDK